MNNAEHQHQQNEINWREALANGATDKEIAPLEKALAASAIAVKREEVRAELAQAKVKEEAEQQALAGIAQTEAAILAFNSKFAAVASKYNDALQVIAKEFATELTQLPNLDHAFGMNQRHHAVLGIEQALPPEIISQCTNLIGAVGGQGAQLVQNVNQYSINVAQRAQRHVRQY